LYLPAQGEYQILDELGRGAFGCVHKACHLPTGQLVCIKAVEAAAGQQSEASMEQQKREVAVLACMQHPNIIK
jgi:serine/threonine protein kinase